MLHADVIGRSLCPARVKNSGFPRITQKTIFVRLELCCWKPTLAFHQNPRYTSGKAAKQIPSVTGRNSHWHTNIKLVLKFLLMGKRC